MDGPFQESTRHSGHLHLISVVLCVLSSSEKWHSIGIYVFYLRPVNVYTIHRCYSRPTLEHSSMPMCHNNDNTWSFETVIS